MGSIDAPGRLIISRSSFVVNAASRGPRRAMMETWLTRERARTSRTGAGMSYLARRERGERSIRAMSSETFPLPMMDTWERSCRGGGGGLDGCWVYQWTRERAGMQ